MIEELLLPKRPRCFLRICATCFDPKGFNKRGQTTRWLEAFGKEVNMVRHEAICVNCEIPGGGLGLEKIEEPEASSGIGEYWVPVEAAQSHKITLAADIVVRGEADIFVEEHLNGVAKSVNIVSQISAEWVIVRVAPEDARLGR